MNKSIYQTVDRLKFEEIDKPILPPTPLVVKLNNIIFWVKHHYHKDPKTNDPYLQIREQRN